MYVATQNQYDKLVATITQKLNSENIRYEDCVPAEYKNYRAAAPNKLLALSRALMVLSQLPGKTLVKIFCKLKWDIDAKKTV